MNNLSKVFSYRNALGEEIVFDYEGGYLISKPVGIDTVSISLSQAQGIQQIGTTVEATNIQSRPVNVVGRIVGKDCAALKERLLSVIRPDMEGKFRCGGFFLSVRPTETPTISAETSLAKFSFSLLAPYPYWIREQGKVVPASGIEYGFKFPWNISKTYWFGKRIQMAYVNVRNLGQTSVPFIVEFLARNEVVNPKISNMLTGEHLLINRTMAVKEHISVEIGHDRTRVISSVSGDISGALSLSSGLFSLDVGDNFLKPEAESGLGDLDVTIRFSEEKVGMTV